MLILIYICVSTMEGPPLEYPCVIINSMPNIVRKHCSYGGELVKVVMVTGTVYIYTSGRYGEYDELAKHAAYKNV